MISDEQRKAFEQWATSQQFCLERFDAVGEYMNDNTHFAWQAWQAAKQIKPLEFVQDSVGDLVAKSTMGNFYVLKMIFSGFVYNGKPYKTEAEAIEAANADYRKRVLSCLVWGVV